MESAIKDEVSYSMECGDEEPENSVTVRGIKGRVGADKGEKSIRCGPLCPPVIDAQKLIPKPKTSKCLRIFGLKQKHLWCTPCQWKKSCTRNYEFTLTYKQGAVRAKNGKGFYWPSDLPGTNTKKCHKILEQTQTHRRCECEYCLFSLYVINFKSHSSFGKAVRITYISTFI